MFLTQGKPERGRLTPFRYGTAGTTTTTTLASSGGLLINIDSATGDIAKTANGWIENERFGCWLQVSSNAVSAEFDTAIIPGEKVLKLSSTNVTGNSFVHLGYDGNFTATASVPSLYKYAFPVKASTKYILKYPVKTETVGANGVYSYLSIYQINGTRNQLLASTKFSGTNDWTWVTHAFTTGATDAFASIGLRNEIAGTISNAYFRLNYMTLEEVVEPVANSLTSSSPSLVSFTAVGSTDNIDQSQLSKPNGFIMNVAGQYVGQQFIPTKSKITGITLQRITSTGTPTGDMVFRIATDSGSDTPTATILATYTMPSATFNALSVGVDFTINLPCNVTAGTKYWILANTTVSSGVNYPGLYSDVTNVYTSGVCKYSADGITYGSTYAGDLYFKTLYYKPTTNFKASQNNSTVTLSADEDGFLNGAFINLITGVYSWNSLIGATGYDTNPYYCDYSRTVGAWVPTTANRIISLTTTSDWIFKLPAGLTNIVVSWDSTVGGGTTTQIASSLDNASYTVASTGTFSGPSTLIDGARFLRLRSEGNNCKISSLSISATYSIAGLSTLRNYPTNKDIIKQYSTTLGSATTSATYRATKWGFPAIEYSEIDQSQLSFSGNVAFGTASQYQAQQFTPTQTSFVGVTFYKKANTGSPSGTMTFSIVNDSANVPGTTVYATYVMSNAEYLALTTNAEFTVNLPCYLPAGTYWIKISYSVSSGTDFPLLGATGGAGAYPGLYKYGTDGITYGVTFAGDSYFKTLYADVYQYLDVDTTATGSTVAFSELGTSYTAVADGASLAITSTSTPNIFVKANITANRLYLSSNDYNASSDKDGSLKQSVVYKVVQ